MKCRDAGQHLISQCAAVHCYTVTFWLHFMHYILFYGCHRAITVIIESCLLMDMTVVERIAPHTKQCSGSLCGRSLPHVALVAMNVDSAVEMAWGSPAVAFHFIVWTGLIKLPKFCPAGHPWTPSASDKYTCLHCRHSRPRTAAEVRMDAHEEREERRRRCNKKASWRAPGSFASVLPTSGTVVKLVKLLYYLITCAPVK